MCGFLTIHWLREKKKKDQDQQKTADKHEAKEKRRQRTTTVKTKKKIQVYAWTNKFSVKETAVSIYLVVYTTGSNFLI